MADRVFKGRLLTTGNISAENARAFPEASESFDKPHKGGLKAYQVIYDVLKSEDQLVREIGESIQVSGSDAWIKIDRDGTFEIGISGGG